MTAETVTNSDVLAYRLGVQAIADPVADPLEALAAGWAIQDSPPGAATSAVLARTRDLEPGWLDRALLEDRSATAIYNPRTATAVLPAAGAPAFATALLPHDDASFAAVLGRAVPEQDADFAEPVDVAVEAIAAALDGQALSRDDLHEELRQRLPKALLPWCEGCGSHHARRGLLVMASLRGKLCIGGRAGRQPVFARTDQWSGWDPPSTEVAQAELAQRFVRWFGPTTVDVLADWAGVSRSHARAVWATIEADLVEVERDGRREWIWGADREALLSPAPDDGVHLIGPGDPLLQARDRAALVPDGATRKRVWTAIPTTGVALSGGAAVATWKAKKARKRLEVTFTPLGRLAKPVREALEAEAERLAPHRGCEGAAVSFA